MDIIFETQSGCYFIIEVGFSDTVLEIKKKVEESQGIPVSKQTLIFHRQVLPDEYDVNKCFLSNYSIVQLDVASDTGTPEVMMKEPSPPEKIHLQIKYPSFMLPFLLQMDKNDTVLRLKEKIQENAAFRLVVLSSGGVLQDHLSLGECELMENEVVDVNVRPLESQDHQSAVNDVIVRPSPSARGKGTMGPPPMPTVSKNLKLFVLSRRRTKKISMEVNASDNVEKLRKELETSHKSSQFPLPVDDYFFTHKQKLMDEKKSFGWHLVEQGDTIEVFSGWPDLEDMDVAVVDVNERSSSERPKKKQRSSPTARGKGTMGPPPPKTVGSKYLNLFVLSRYETRKISLEVNASDNVKELRKELKILDERFLFPLPQERYFFIHNQRVMDDDTSFRCQQVKQGDTIQVFPG